MNSQRGRLFNILVTSAFKCNQLRLKILSIHGENTFIYLTKEELNPIMLSMAQIDALRLLFLAEEARK